MLTQTKVPDLVSVQRALDPDADCTPRRLSDILREITDAPATPDKRILLVHLIEGFGNRAFGALLFIFAVTSALPIAIPGTEPSMARRTAVVEVMVGPDTRALHGMIGRLYWRRRFGVYPMALHRNGTGLDMPLSMMRLAVGDTQLLDGTSEDIARLVDDERLIMLSPVKARAFLRSRARVAIGTMAGVVVLVLAPHPDDESLGCGALLAAAFALSGVNGAASDSESQSIPPAQLADIRKLELQTAVTRLGGGRDARLSSRPGTKPTAFAHVRLPLLDRSQTFWWSRTIMRMPWVVFQFGQGQR